MAKLISVKTVVVANDVKGKCHDRIETIEQLAEQITYMVRMINNVANRLNYAYEVQVDAVTGEHYITSDQKLEQQKDLSEAYTPLSFYAQEQLEISGDPKKRKLAEYIYSLGRIIKVVDELEVREVRTWQDWYDDLVLGIDKVITKVKEIAPYIPGLPEFVPNLKWFFRKALAVGMWGGLGYITYRVSSDIIVPLVRKD